jgi:hypothetical protein
MFDRCLTRDAQGVDQAALSSSLDACLLTEEEFALQPAEWKTLCDDPFETAQVCDRPVF